MSALRILLVEDDVGAAALANRLLAGHRVRLAMTRGQASHALAGETFDAIVLDLGLPDADGFDLLLSDEVKTRRIPVVIYTGRDDVRLSAASRAVGVWEVLLKGRDDDDLEATVRAAVVAEKARMSCDEAIRDLRWRRTTLERILGWPAAGT